MGKPGPLRLVAYKCLADGEWHDLEEVIVKIMNSPEMHPGRAYRKRQAVVENWRRRSEWEGGTHRLDNEEILRIGARRLAGETVRGPFFEFKYEEELDVFGKPVRRRKVRLAKPLPAFYFAGDESPPKRTGNHYRVDRDAVLNEIVAKVRQHPGLGKEALFRELTTVGSRTLGLKLITYAAQRGLIRAESPVRSDHFRYYPVTE
jgi:hypothetical protein